MRISDMEVLRAITGQETVPIYDPNGAERIQQNKRVPLSLLKGNRGDRGFRGLSNYEIWLNQGNQGTEKDYLASNKGEDGKDGDDGEDGKSSYQSWLDVGNKGSEAEFVKSLKGDSNYDIWLRNGNKGTEEEFLETQRGSRGYSNYELWLQAGNKGTQEEFLESYRGKEGKQGNKGDKGEKGTSWFSSFSPPNAADGNIGDFHLDFQTGELYGQKTAEGWGLPKINLTGPTGKAGTIWYSGNGVPSESLGLINDRYLNHVNGDVYAKTQSGWGNPTGNIKGPGGSVWYNSTKIPNNTEGSNGDYWITEPNGDVYYKSANSWKRVAKGSGTKASNTEFGAVRLAVDADMTETSTEALAIPPATLIRYLEKQKNLYGPFPGTFMDYYGTNLPSGSVGWVFPDGSRYSVADYPDIVKNNSFIVDGQGFFTVPDHRGKSSVMTSASFPFKGSGGNAKVKITRDNLPAEGVEYIDTAHMENNGHKPGNVNRTGSGDSDGDNGFIYRDRNNNLVTTVPAENLKPLTSNLGKGLEMDNMHPYLVIGKLIYLGRRAT